MTIRRTQRKISSKPQKAKTRVTNVAQPLSFNPDAASVIQRRAIRRTVSPPTQSVARPNLVLGWTIRRTQRNANQDAQNVKTTVTNVAQPLSFDPDAEAVIQ